MNIFALTLNEMVYFFTLIIIGYVVKKTKIFGDTFESVVSRFLSFVVTPALIIKNFYEKFKVDILTENLFIFLTGCFLVVILYTVAIFLSKIFTKDDYIKKIYTYSFTNANFGYMGYVLIEALFGSEALFYMIIFTIPCNIYAFTIGINSFNPECKKISVKNFITPVTISLVIGAILGLSGVILPGFATKTLTNLSSILGPMAMILTGFVVAKYDIVQVIKDYKIYFASLIRLIVIPVTIVSALKFFNADRMLIMIALCTFSMPFGLNSVIFPAAYEQDTKTGAGMAIISDILAVITIPILFYFYL